MTWVIKLARYNELTSAIIGLLSNFLLLYLIMTVNKANMKQTSRILLQNCFIDMLLAVSTLLAGVHTVCINKVYYLIFGSSFRYLGFEFGSWFICTFAACIVLSIQAMPVPFYLRYLALCKNKAAKAQNIIFAYTLVFPCFILTFILTMWCYPPNTEIYQKFIPATQTSFWLDEYPNGVVFVAREMDAALTTLYSFVFFTTFVSYSFVIFFSVKISKRLRTHISTFKQTKILNKQLHLTLIVQAIGPIITGNIPIFCLIFMILSGYENNYITVGMSSILGWVAVVNPIAAMVIMSPYRKRIKEILRLEKNSDIVTVSANSTVKT